MKAICTRWQWIGILAVVAMAFAGCAGDSVGTTFEVSEGEDGPGALLGGESGEEGGTKPGGGAPVIETESDTSSSSTEQDSTGVESDTEEEDAGTPGPFPGEFGYPCDGNEDCLSGFCVDSEQGKVCTEVCLENCPQGWECTQVSGLGGDVIYICVSKFANLCKPCTSSEQCNAGGLDGNACVDAGAPDCFAESLAKRTWTVPQGTRATMLCLNQERKVSSALWRRENAPAQKCSSRKRPRPRVPTRMNLVPARVSESAERMA